MNLAPPAPRPDTIEPHIAVKPPPRRTRLPWVCATCLTVLVLIIATPAIFYFRASSQCARFTPTGDALFDRYAAAVIERQAPRLFIKAAGQPAVIALPDATLAAWEAEFGGDPRYWQLRYLCTDLPEPPVTEQPTLEASPGTKFLEQAREQGTVDFDTLYALWGEYIHQWAREYELEQDDPEYQYYRDDPVRFEQAMIERHGVEMQALLDEMVAASPDESFPYYRRSRYYFVQGEYDPALSDLKAGNAASANRMPGVFPVSFVQRGLSAGNELDNKYVGGGLLLKGFIASQENYGAWREYGKSIQQLDVPNLREWSNEYHRFACRFGLMEGAEWMDRSVSGRMVRNIVEDYLVNRPEEQTVAERQALFQLAMRSNSISREQRLQSAMAPDEEDWMYHQSILKVVTGSMIEYDSQSLLYDYDYIACEFRDADRSIARVIERLVQFDYVTMSWPEDGANAPFAGDFGPGELRSTQEPEEPE